LGKVNSDESKCRSLQFVSAKTHFDIAELVSIKQLFLLRSV